MDPLALRPAMARGCSSTEGLQPLRARPLPWMPPTVITPLAPRGAEAPLGAEPACLLPPSLPPHSTVTSTGSLFLPLWLLSHVLPHW